MRLRNIVVSECLARAESLQSSSEEESESGDNGRPPKCSTDSGDKGGSSQTYDVGEQLPPSSKEVPQ